VKISHEEHERIGRILDEHTRPKCEQDCPICGGTGTVAMLDPITYRPLGEKPCPQSDKGLEHQR